MNFTKSHRIVPGIVLGTILLVALIAAVSTPVRLSAETQQIPQRSEIDDKYKWDLTVMFQTIEQWETEFAAVEAIYPRLKSYQGRLAESSEVLYECVKLQQEINIRADNLSVYASLKLSEDMRVSSNQELSGRMSALWSKISEASSYIEPELLSIDADKLQAMLSEKAELEIYRFYLEDLIRSKGHILSQEEESIMALAGSITGSAGSIYSMLTEADMKFGTIYDEDSNLVELTDQRYSKFRTSPDRRVRRDSHIAYYGTYEKYSNTIAATLGGALKKDLFRMKARGYETCLEMALDRNNIPLSVYHNLIETVNNNLEPLHKWAQLKKKVLGYDTLYAYDLYVPLVADYNKSYTYEEAIELNIQSMTPMGEAYVADFKKGLESGWIDVYETEGKSGGAFSGGSYTSPPYILLNYNGTIQWVFTLAHEMGHSMQSYYVNQNEPYIYSDYTIFVAEVASTGCEAILMEHLIKNAKDKKEKMYLLNLYIQDIRTTFFRQVMFGEFELAIHTHMENGGAFSSDYFTKTFSDIYQKYWGEALAVDELSGFLGMSVPHFYWQYYVYQYATCFAAAQLMSHNIVNDTDGYLDTYLKFLSTGSSKYPVDVLAEGGVDMTAQEPILNTIRNFSKMVDELERLLEEE